MLSHQFYNLVHIVGIVLIMAALGGTAASSGSASRGGWTGRGSLAFHLLGVFLILLGGFGMLARLGIVQGSSWPGWIWAKVIIWVVLGMAALVPRRFPHTALPMMVALPLLGGLAAYMAIYKPF